ncbi:MAG: carbamoyl-phosphate synthase large subunit [Chloroflexota bacterium]
MPRRDDVRSVLVLGSGPIVIGQAAEFDYSGTQAVKALKREGLRVILVNSNPATIMTDPELADATYVDPLTVPVLEQIIARERPDALLPTVGGQTALNLTVELAEAGVLARYGVQLLGASIPAIRVAEDRILFKQAMADAGLTMPRGGEVHTLAEAQALAAELGYPLLCRPSFTLGGTGGGIAYAAADLQAVVEHGLRESPIHQVLVEESVLGWKEFELEVMADGAGGFVVVCSIENFDPMGVHTGDSITVAPAQTLTDKEYQRLRDMARRVMAAVGVQTGGSNVQFAVNPVDGRTLVIEMNPRVSRSSALASKATGFPIAKLAALVALGYTLDELKNDITGETVAAYEPSLDYVVVKIPRWGFEKFPGASVTLGPQMKSVGEVMAIGRTFKEALQKAVRSLEDSRDGLDRADAAKPGGMLGVADPGPQRLYALYGALLDGAGAEALAHKTGIDCWFLEHMGQIATLERHIREKADQAQRPEATGNGLPTYAAALTGSETDATLRQSLPASVLQRAKSYGFSDHQLARFCHVPEEAVRRHRQGLGIVPTFARVDTCAAEFAAQTPYLYSTYERAVSQLSGDDIVPIEVTEEAPRTGRRSVLILGSGPNRIGQGIEFDYCCCHAAFALHDLGLETIMVNCNPETVSTDYDTSDRLYFEPLTLEDVLAIVQREQPAGVVLQFGGQTPLKLAKALQEEGVPIWGTSFDAIDLAEDRERFGALLDTLDIPQSEHGFAYSLDEARQVAARIGYPLLVRPSYVLGGRAMAIVYDDTALNTFGEEAKTAAEGRAFLLDRYLEDAVELDVDAVGDGKRVIIGGVMEHIEEAGVHSGDSACVLPPFRVPPAELATVRDYTIRLGHALGVRGLLNVQFAIQGHRVYVLEVNPRASRTVPFVSKATGVPLAKVAARVMAGQSLEEAGLPGEPSVHGYFIKEAVLPFRKLPGSDARLGPEMHSTGEVMGHAPDFAHAFAKASLGAGDGLPDGGMALLSVNDSDKRFIVKLASDLRDLGFGLIATHGTAAKLAAAGLPVRSVNKVAQGSPHVVDLIRQGEVQIVINTPIGSMAFEDGAEIRLTALRQRVPLVTTISAALAVVGAIRALHSEALVVRSLQEHYRLSGGENVPS